MSKIRLSLASIIGMFAYPAVAPSRMAPAYTLGIAQALPSEAALAPPFHMHTIFALKDHVAEGW